MIHLSQHQEYSARYGLKNALNKSTANPVELAQQLAESKYRDLVGRDIVSSEIADIHHLIEELRLWVSPPPKLPDNYCSQSL
ncbi:MAG: hypothetical protein EOP48_28210 [Sphingobacteriales bacterium]|nr:MAG: hypothetical protein EOP48_28210 [Sphingobacteriales bacterium]